MTLNYILLKNLGRNPVRTTLTAIAFALPMAVFVVAMSFVVAMGKISESNAAELRLAVHQKSTITIALPEAMRRRIEALDPDHERLVAVCGMKWFGGEVPDTKKTITSLAADADTFPIVYSDAGLEDDEERKWLRDRTAAVVGKSLAELYDWSVGDRVTLTSTVPPYLSLEFNVVRVMTNNSKAAFFFFRRDYLEESLKKAGFDNPRCNIFWVKCTSIAAMRTLQRDIDATFSNSPDETKSEDENAFGAMFLQAAGDLPGLMRVMAIVVVAMISMIAGNTMMMGFRERTRELAVFKALGFSRLRVFGMVLGEGLLLAVIGALIGIVPTAIGIGRIPAEVLANARLSELNVTPIAIAASLAIAVVVGLCASIWPAWQAMRLRAVDALRRAV
jgi:putative ABC transport system permease protein